MLLFGHVMMANGLEKKTMLVCGEGRRKRCVEEIQTISLSEINQAELMDYAEDLGSWRRRTVANISRIDGIK